MTLITLIMKYQSERTDPNYLTLIMTLIMRLDLAFNSMVADDFDVMGFDQQQADSRPA